LLKLSASTKGLRLELYNPKRYEALIIKTLTASGVRGSIHSVAGNDPNRPDADIRINGKIYNIEVKADNHAQMGGGSVGYSRSDKRFFPTGQNKDLSQVVVSVLNDLNDSSLCRGLSTLMNYLSKVSDKKFNTIPMHGFNERAWQQAVNSGMLLPINRMFSSDVNIINDHYARKNTFYMQIGSAGFFSLGNNPANLPVPPLTGKVQLEVRLAKAGKPSAGVRVQARLVTNGKSPYTLDDSESIKKMLTNVKKEQRVNKAA